MVIPILFHNIDRELGFLEIKAVNLYVLAQKLDYELFLGKKPPEILLLTHLNNPGAEGL